MKTLEQNDSYTLRLEWMGKRNGGYWLELIDRASGRVKILAHTQKGFFDGVTLDHALRWMARLEWSPMYKAGVM